MVNTARPVTLPRAQAVESATKEADFSVRFWGVRGSVPTPSLDHQRYGGNTVCVEVVIGDRRIIFDGGTGLVGLGRALSQTEESACAHLFFTHTQWDRIQGFPFFQPAFNPHNHFSIYGGIAPNGASIKHCLTEQMLKPHFSMPLQNMRASLDFHTVLERDTFQIDDITIEAFAINPLTAAFGYRLTWQNRVLVYATDTPTQCIDLNFLKIAHQADILIYDGTYSDLGYLRYGSVPSSSLEPWEIGIEIAEKADVKEFVLLHHSPMQDDQALDRLQKDISDRFAKATIAYEGLTLAIASP